MEKVQNLKNSNTAPSSKTFRDENSRGFELFIETEEHVKARLSTCLQIPIIHIWGLHTTHADWL
jgi:hypothetical protein